MNPTHLLRLFKKYTLATLGLFTVVRGYNILLLVIAMYLTVFSFFAKDLHWNEILIHYGFVFIALASACTVSAGYIINNFYDLKKDAISRPLTTYVSRFVSQNFSLTVYLILNFLGLIFAYLTSWRVALFFLVYQFLVWLYSHKLNRILFVNNILSTCLALMPFLALLLYFNVYTKVIFLHGGFLFLLLLITDIVKDLTSYKADLIFNYQTIPVQLGQNQTKLMLLILMLTAIGYSLFMSFLPQIGQMKWFFLICVATFILLSVLIWFVQEKWQYHIFHFMCKGLIGLGVFSLIWLKINPVDLQQIL